MGGLLARCVLISACLLAALCASAPLTKAQPADAPKEVLLVEMVAQSVKTLPFKQEEAETLRIWRWSTPEDVLWIKECLGKGDQQSLKKKMIKREPLGRLEGYDICYATCTRLKDGTFEILCVTPVRLGLEVQHEDRLVFSAIQLLLDGNGQGLGTVYSFARFAVTEDNRCKIQTCRDPSFRLIGAKALVFTP